MKRSTSALARAVGPVLTGVLFDVPFGNFLPSREPHALAFWLGSLLSLLGLVFILFFRRSDEQKREGERQALLVNGDTGPLPSSGCWHTGSPGRKRPQPAAASL